MLRRAASTSKKTFGGCDHAKVRRTSPLRDLDASTSVLWQRSRLSARLGSNSQPDRRLLSASSIRRASSLSDVNYITDDDQGYQGMSSLLSPARPYNMHPAKNQIAKAFLQEQNFSEYSSVEDDDVSKIKTREGTYRALGPLVQKLSEGQIIDPMSIFYEDALPHMLGTAQIGDISINAIAISNMLRILSSVSVRSPDQWSQVRQKITARPFWKPAQLSNDMNVEDIPVPVLCVYAIGTVYDIAGTLNLRPSFASLAGTIRALASHLDFTTFAQCLSLILLQMSGRTFHEAQQRAEERPLCLHDFDADRIPANILSAVIDGLGTQGKPEAAEIFLRWSSSRRFKHHRGSASTRTVRAPGEDGAPGALIDVDQWGPSYGVWTSLVRSWAQNKDVVKAKHWLDQYRAWTGATGAKRKSDPYLAYYRGCAVQGANLTLDNLKAESLEGFEQRKGLRYAYLRDLTTSLAEDRVSLDPRQFAMTLNIEAGFGNLRESAKFAHLALSSQLVYRVTPILYKALFRLHRMCAIRTQGRENAFQHLLERPIPYKVVQRYGRYDVIRDLFRLCAYRFTPELKRKDSIGELSELIEEALRCALTIGDLPLAFAMLEFRQIRGIEYDHGVDFKLLDWLTRCRNGFGGVQDPVEEMEVYGNATSISDLERRRTLSVQAARNRLDILAESVSSSSDGNHSATETKTQGYRIDLRKHVKAKLVQSVRIALRTGPNAQREGEYAEWLMHACTLLRASDSETTDAAIMKTVMHGLLVDRNGPSMIPILRHLLDDA